MAHNVTDSIPVGIGKDDKEKQRQWALGAMNIAIHRGPVRIAQGVFLYDCKAMIGIQEKLPKNDKRKKTDYTSAPFWIVIQPEEEALPFYGPMEIVSFIGLDRWGKG